MINYYQPWLVPFLQKQSIHLPQSIKSYYYHSFEDGLWDLLINKFPKGKKLLILVPDFYCSDVLDNIRLHGHNYIYYPLDKHFQITVSLFKKYLWLNKPDVIIIFNVCGITSELLLDTSWLTDLPSQALIIEDSVHCLTNPATVHFINGRHYIMDSLRKVSPLPGSRMFGTLKAMDFPQSSSSYLSSYYLRSTFLYILFRLVFKIGMLTNSSSLTSWSHTFLLKNHDDIIGDSFQPQPGHKLFLPVVNRLNYSKVMAHKTKQINLYHKYFKSLFKHQYFYKINIPASDYGRMHVYPLGINFPPDKNLITYLHRKNISVWFKFTDVPWSEHRSVLFLPLGFHIHEPDIIYLAQVLSEYVEQARLNHFSPYN